MKPIKSSIVRSLPMGTRLVCCDNSGAQMAQIISVKGHKTVRRRRPAAAIGDLVNVAVIKGRPDMRKQVVQAVIVRQAKEYKRPDGTRIKFADNAVVVLKDDKGTPKGTIFKGPIAKEAADRWPGIAKVASLVI